MWLTRVASKSELDIDKRPQFLSIWASLWGCIVAASRVNNLRGQSRTCKTSYDLKPYIIIATVFHWSHRSALIQHEEDYPKA